MQRPDEQRESRLVEAALEQYSMPDADFVFLEVRGRNKLLCRVDVPAPGPHSLRKLFFRAEPPAPERFLLRLHARHSIGAQRLRSEMMLLRDLRRESDLLVPEPTLGASGTSFVVNVTAEGSTESWLCVLLRWVPGVNKTPHLVPENLFSAGSLVARMHRHSERYAFPEGFARPHIYECEGMFGQASPLWNKDRVLLAHSELEVFRTAAERIRSALQALGKEKDIFGLIHADPTPNNFVFRHGETSIIDFASCGWGHYLYDVAVTLSALEAFGERRAELRSAFLGGYRRERFLPECYEKYLGMFRAVRLVRRVATVLDRGDPAQRNWGSRRFSRVAERLEKYLASDGELERMDL